MYKLPMPLDVLVPRMQEHEKEKFLQGVAVSPLQFFCPNGAQERIIRTMAESINHTQIPTLTITYGNGLGKTTVAMHILANLVCGVQNGWFDYDLFHNWPFPKQAWYVSKADAIKDKFQKDFLALISPLGIKWEVGNEKYVETSKGGYRYISDYSFPNSGWTISCKTYDQDAETFESVETGLQIYDEPMPLAIKKAGKSRRRLGCITLNVMTPLKCNPEILDDIESAKQEVEQGKKQKHWHFDGSIYEACQKRGVRGHLAADIIDDMVDEYDEEEKEARVYGKPMYFSGKVYKELNWTSHFVEPTDYPIPQYSIIKQVVDPKDRRACACIYAALTPENRLIIFNETPISDPKRRKDYWQMDSSVSFADEIVVWDSIENDFDIQYHKIAKTCTNTKVMDKYFGFQSRGKKSLAQLFAEENPKYVFRKSYEGSFPEGEIEYGHKQVRKALKPMADGKPGLVIWNTCYHTWRGMTHYTRENLTGKQEERKAKSDGVLIEKYKDFPDVVRYLVCDPMLPPKKPTTMTKTEIYLAKLEAEESGQERVREY